MASSVTTPNVETFKGTGWEECDTFVRSIRAAAWKENKLNDDLWIANYASLHLAGKALRWHSRLSPDVRRDWSKLEVALLDQWPSPDDIDGENSTRVPIIPTPAAAPSNSTYNPNTTIGQVSRRAVIKIISAISNTVFYLGQPGTEGECTLTEKIGNALHVSVDLNSSPHSMAMLPTQGEPTHKFFWVGIHWISKEPRVESGSNHWARIALIDSITMKSSWSRSYPVFRITTWDISVGGEIRPAWFQDNQKQILDTFIHEEDRDIAVAADSSVYENDFPQDSRAVGVHDSAIQSPDPLQ